MNWLISVGAVYGTMFLCMALYSIATLRGRPVLLDHRWLSFPGTWFTLYYFWVEFSADDWAGWGVDDRTGLFLGVVVATVGMLGAFRVFPTHWGGLVVLGVKRSEVRKIMKHALRELDSSARLEKEQWYSDAYAAEVRTHEVLGKSILRIRFSGAGAGELSHDLLPLLRHDFVELGIDGGDEAVTFARRVLWLFFGLLVGILLLGWMGYAYSHSLHGA